MYISKTPAAIHRRPLKSRLCNRLRGKYMHNKSPKQTQADVGNTRHSKTQKIKADSGRCWKHKVWAFKTCVFVHFGPFKGGLGRPFWHSGGAWGHTWALGKDLGALLALFCDLLGCPFGIFGDPCGRHWVPLGFVWALFGRLWGALGVILDTLRRHFGHLRAFFAYIG